MKIHHYPSAAAEKRLATIVHRDPGCTEKQVHFVSAILKQVQKKGDTALLDYTRRFDAPNLTQKNMVITQKAMAKAADQVDDDFTRSLDRAIKQITAFHKRQIQNGFLTMDRPGVLLGQIVNPVDSAGIYVPGGKGGKTPLVSSLLMGAIPAKIAGVEKIFVATPPRADGGVDPHLLAAAQKTGVDAVIKAGSAWGVAALAFGTQTVPRVDVIVGPGNLYVTLAKKLVSGLVGIDMLAGPSEILVIADDGADPEFISADLLSQAEHDPLASAMLVTPSRKMAQRTLTAVKTQVEDLQRKEIAQTSLKKFGAIFVVSNMDEAFFLVNQIAPEHLELQIQDPMTRLNSIKNAGAVFIGPYTPEAMGDYMAGPNHVLPTAGTARFASALGVSNFQKKTSLIRYSQRAFEEEAGDVARMAKIEGLEAHMRSIKIRRL